MSVDVSVCLCGREFAEDGSGCPVHGTRRLCPVCLEWNNWLVQREGRVDLCARCVTLVEQTVIEVDDVMLKRIQHALDATAIPFMEVIENEPAPNERRTAKAGGLKSLVLGFQIPGKDFTEVGFSDWFKTENIQGHLRFPLYQLLADARGWLASLHAEVLRLRTENAELHRDLDQLRAQSPAPAPEPEHTEPLTVTDLRLSARSYKVLARNDIRLISDLVKMSRTDLLDLPDCGITSVKIIENELDRLGLSLRSDDV